MGGQLALSLIRVELQEASQLAPPPITVGRADQGGGVHQGRGWQGGGGEGKFGRLSALKGWKILIRGGTAARTGCKVGLPHPLI